MEAFLPTVIYEDWFVAFIDVLGFSELIKRSESKDEAGDKAVEKITSYWRAIYQALRRFESVNGQTSMFYLAASDSLVLAIPSKAINGSELESLRELCIAVGSIQWDMAIHGIWMRGGISQGPCCIDRTRNQIVGPAFLKAYELENKRAKFPRVILDTKMIFNFGYESKTDIILAINKIKLASPTTTWNTDVLFLWPDPQRKIPVHIEEDYPLFIDYLSPWKIEENHSIIEVIVELLIKEIYLVPDYENCAGLPTT